MVDTAIEGTIKRIASALTGAHSRPCWRRGNWRHQVYGAGRALRRPLWIMPVTVHKESDADIPGHTNLVGSPELAPWPESN